MDSLSSVSHSIPLAPENTLEPIDPGLLPKVPLKRVARHLSWQDAQSLGRAFPKINAVLGQFKSEDFGRKIGSGATRCERGKNTRQLFSELWEWIEKGWVTGVFLKYEHSPPVEGSKIDIWATLNNLASFRTHDIDTQYDAKDAWVNLLNKEVGSWRAGRLGRPMFSSPLWRFLLKKWLKSPYLPFFNEELIFCDELFKIACELKNELLFQFVTKAFLDCPLDEATLGTMVTLNWSIPPNASYLLRAYYRVNGEIPSGALETVPQWRSNCRLRFNRGEQLRTALVRAFENNAERAGQSLIRHFLTDGIAGSFFTSNSPSEPNPFLVACRLGKLEALKKICRAADHWCTAMTLSHERGGMKEVVNQGRLLAEKNGHDEVVKFLCGGLSGVLLR